MLLLWYSSDHCQLSIACAFLMLISGFRELEELPCEQLPCVRIFRNKHSGPSHCCSISFTPLPVLEPLGVKDRSKHGIDETPKLANNHENIKHYSKGSSSFTWKRAGYLAGHKSLLNFYSNGTQLLSVSFPKKNEAPTFKWTEKLVDNKANIILS